MQQGSRQQLPHWAARLPFYYGWLIVGIAFVTMAIGVSARTAFSLLMPPLIDEFGWDRGLAAGAFSFGFLVSAVLSPVVGRVIKTLPRWEVEFIARVVQRALARSLQRRLAVTGADQSRVVSVGGERPVAMARPRQVG